MARVRVEVPVEDGPAKNQQASTEQPAPEASANHHTVSKGSNAKKAILIIIGLLVVFFVLNLINERNQLQKQLTSSNTGSNQKAEDIVALLSKSVELPTGEVPQMRTIEDASRFTVQNPSLGDIKNGDQLLFFEKSQKVVVYRPSTKKAVVVVTLAQPTTESSQNPGQ